ncbi:MAG: rRNA methyltransferase [Chloroflexi bacterium AL-W]|nr:rRNA methyltransferase [Chloroflexi bacterium AL-N1]NOK70457.1 rRNA methyltransferase [Chloroflexi bacterium AL-N10]NOK78184.1 rRNA methyltransferase [Chloroflexi bacterium AL-N5]NOK85283.1 rRNA methyltransferase [Chloroflexi bacterium AL-W]NOK92048.1 rRNA methyltransferase [Chloroflexi bacterium AL-N15]
MNTDNLPGMLSLPQDLQKGIEQVLATVPATQWIHESQALSERYRSSRVAGREPLASGIAQVLGYAALIMPATYAQLVGAMHATAIRVPHWQPQTMLDMGSGPGTALWAAVAQWPTLHSLVAWEREPAFIDLGQQLASGSTTSAIREARWESIDLSHRSPSGAYDLVVLGHVLNELDPNTQRNVITSAWRMTNGLLLIVEPGTLDTFAVVRAARDALLDEGAHTIAPCVHNHSCPLQNDWCHFPQRLKRPPFQRRARGAPSEWEDSKFSYAAMARFYTSQPAWARVIREATSNKAYAETTISGSAGVTRYRALKRHREAFKQIKKMRWGILLDEPLTDPIKPVEEK